MPICEWRRGAARGYARSTEALRPEQPVGREPELERLGVVLDDLQRGSARCLAIEGEPRPLAQGVDLSAYRILQEALTNVVKHAGRVPTTVMLGYRADTLELTVTDTGQARVTAAGPGGHGLVGMRERVRVCGGELHTGRTRSGGFEVDARLPLQDEAEAALAAGAHRDPVEANA